MRTKTMSIGEAISKIVEALLAEGRRVTSELVEEQLLESYQDVVDAEEARLRKAQIWKLVRDYTRRSQGDEDEDGQMVLPDIGIPRLLDIHSDGESYVLRAEDATLAELEVGRTARFNNVVRAQVRLDRYDEGLAQVGRIMRTDPKMPMRAALKQLGLWPEEKK